MEDKWRTVAQRMVQGLDVQPREVIQVRDNAGRFDLLQEALLAIELAGATPLPHITPAGYMERLWSEASLESLVNWDHHRRRWLQRTDRILVLGGAQPDLDSVPQKAFLKWLGAEKRMTKTEEERRLPFLLAAIPTERRADQLGLTLAELEGILLPALGVELEELQHEIGRVREVVEGSRSLTIRSGPGCELHLALGDRLWLSDDGCIDEQDRLRGAIVSNLPSGAVYTTVLEDRTEGGLWLPRAEDAREVVLRFEAGRIVDIEAGRGAQALAGMLDRHSGEARRVGHVGLGLNAALTEPAGWPLVDHVGHGRVWVSLGENRYMGGLNASSLNVDYTIFDASLLADDRPIVLEGRVVV